MILREGHPTLSDRWRLFLYNTFSRRFWNAYATLRGFKGRMAPMTLADLEWAREAFARDDLQLP